MNISSVGSPAQYATMAAADSVSASVDGSVLNEVKAEGQDTVDLINSAASQPQAGHALSVYA
jgi:hypothetical protein